MAIFDDFDWSMVAPIAASLGGAYLTSRANDAAKQSYQQGQQANVNAITQGANTANTAITAGRDAGTTAITTGRDNAIDSIKAGGTASAATNQATMDLANDRAAPGIQLFKQNVSRDPNQLTPQQQIAMQDASRSAINNVAPGLRGSGRATAAINDDLVNRTKAGFVATNTALANDSAKALAANTAAGYTAAGNKAATEAATGTNVGNAQQNAGNNVANVNTNAGNNLANVATSTGNAVGKSMADTGTVNANADTAGGTANASALGAIGSIVANSNKDATRNTRYANYKSQTENPV